MEIGTPTPADATLYATEEEATDRGVRDPWLVQDDRTDSPTRGEWGYIERPVSRRYIIAKRVVEHNTAEILEGVLLDLFTASAMVAVFEAMNEANQTRFDSLPLEKLAAFCVSKVSFK